MKTPRALVIGVVPLLMLAALAGAQTWTPLTHQPGFGATWPFGVDGWHGCKQQSADTAPAWWKLTPSNTGSYINGTWCIFDAPGYAPTYYASAVLADGGSLWKEEKTITIPSGRDCPRAIYDPQAQLDEHVPPAWGGIGDAQSVVLQETPCWVIVAP
jgi:hypothetical protein